MVGYGTALERGQDVQEQAAGLGGSRQVTVMVVRYTVILLDLIYTHFNS